MLKIYLFIVFLNKNIKRFLKIVKIFYKIWSYLYFYFNYFLINNINFNYFKYNYNKIFLYNITFLISFINFN